MNHFIHKRRSTEHYTQVHLPPYIIQEIVEPVFRVL